MHLRKLLLLLAVLTGLAFAIRAEYSVGIARQGGGYRIASYLAGPY